MIEKADAESYFISVLGTHDSEKVDFHAYLVKIGRCMFLDAVDRNTEKGDSLAIPGHIIARVWLGPDSLRIAYLDDDGISENDPVGASRVPEFGTVLTGSTADLQQFVTAHEDDNSVFAQYGDEMHRKN